MRLIHSWTRSTRLCVVVKVGDNAHRAGGNLATDAVDPAVREGVGVLDDVAATADDGAVAAVRGADLHAQDLGLVEGLGGESGLSLDDGRVPAGPAVVLAAAEIELTPGAGVATVGVDGEGVALGGTPGALGVLVEGDVADLVGLQVELDGGVAVVPTGHFHVRADLIPDGDVERIGLAAVELDDVFVLGGLFGADLDHVATPWVANVA